MKEKGTMETENFAQKPRGDGRKGALRDNISRRFWLLEGNLLRERAQHRTGLHDFGDPQVEPALSKLVNSLETEADLHPLGRFLMWGHLLEILETRLRLTQAWRGKETMLASSPIRRPIFITGMPRSGSTFLHELMGQDPGNRSPRVWEVMFPLAAAAPEGTGRHHQHMRKAEIRLWWFRRFAPKADSVYPARANTPHECLTIHSYTLMSEEFVSTCRVPSYEKFLRQTGLRSAYAWEKLFLQHLQSNGAEKRWILKSPDHLYGLEELFSVFPDAVVVQTHRDPLDVLRSQLQLIGVLQGLFARPGDAQQLRVRETRVLAEAMERSMRFRDAHPELAGRFFDLNYSELVADPLGAVRRIYERFDISLSDTAAERMRQFVSTRSRYPRRHNPTLRDLGLDPREETNRFRNYCFRFGIACQQPDAG